MTVSSIRLQALQKPRPNLSLLFYPRAQHNTQYIKKKKSLSLHLLSRTLQFQSPTIKKEHKNYLKIENKQD